MKPEKYAELISYLIKQKEPVTARNLADYLNVSVRTIKNYITVINKNAGIIIVMSSPLGYEVNKAGMKEYLKNHKEREFQIPQSYEERADFINRQFLLQHKNCLDLYDLSEEMCFSIETIKNDIKRMNQSFFDMGISYYIHSNYVYLKADEISLRKLAKLTLFGQLNSGMINYTTIQEAFPEIDTEIIKRSLEYVLEHFGLYVNDFGMMNMVLHLSIIIKRMKDENFLEVNQKAYINENSIEYKAAKELCRELEKRFYLTFNEQEEENVYFQFKSNANIAVCENKEDIRRYIGEELYQFVEEIVKGINDKYYVNLCDSRFLLPFSMHIKNLIFRVYNYQSSVDLMCGAIHCSHPIIFDMAVFAAHMIGKKYKIKVDENEVSYLALHIGGEVERQELNIEKVRVVLLCPNYLEFAMKMYNQILITFSDDIELLACIHTEDEIPKYHFELLITTVALSEKHCAYEVINIPFLGVQKHKMDIEEKIEEIREKRRVQMLKTELNNYFDENLFFVNKGVFDKKEEIMKVMANRMIEMKVVGADYYERIMERERAASTGFPNIAVPHSMQMDAVRTRIGVMVCPAGVQWGRYRVRLVLVMAIREADSRRFGEIYQALIQLFENEKNLKKVIMATTFEDFIRKIEQLL